MSVGEMYLRRNGVDLVTTGKSYAHSTASFGTSGQNLFNGSLDDWTNSWAVSPVSLLPAWASIDMGSAVSVDQIGITLGTGQFTNEGPMSFAVQYSNDGANWSNAVNVPNETGWVLLVRRDYDVSAA